MLVYFTVLPNLHILLLWILPVFRFGVRFPCMSDAYDKDICSIAMETAKELGYAPFIQQGVYTMVAGPSYETIAECNMLRMLGADAVGE